MNIIVRTAAKPDVPAITAIYNQAIALGNATAHTEPVDNAERLSWLISHDPATDPVYVAEQGESVIGYCSISAYRPGRRALRHTKEISYYMHEDYRAQGVGTILIQHAIDQCPALQIKTLFAILLDNNPGSVALLEKFGFEQWGHMPKVADFGDTEVGHCYYGLRLL